MQAELHLFANNRRLAKTELQRGRDAVAAVHPLIAGRDEFIKAHNLDPKFCLPDKSWEPGSRGVDAEIQRNPEFLEVLRFNVSQFSGFDMSYFGRREDLPPGVLKRRLEERPPQYFYPVPEDLDTKLAARLNAFHYNNTWLGLVGITPMNLLFSLPPICGEIGWKINGVIVNHDTVVYQERMSILGWLGIFQFLETIVAKRGFARVLEIGGGFGALAYQIKKSFPNIAYTICDLPESLFASAAYLSLARPDLGTHIVSETSRSVDALNEFHFMSNAALPVFAGNYTFDLVINTLSMSEMSVLQVCKYGELISQMIGGTGIFFEQNQDNTHLGLINCKAHLPRYFLRHAKIDPPPFRISQGMITMWSNGRYDFPLR